MRSNVISTQFEKIFRANTEDVQNLLKRNLEIQTLGSSVFGHFQPQKLLH